MSISLRIKELRKQKKLSQSDFAAQIGVTQASVSHYENGDRTPDTAFMDKICSAFNVNLNWLVTGTGPMFLSKERARAKEFTATLRLPVIGDIAAGFPAEVIPEEDTAFLELPSSLLSLPPPYYVFTVDGESMLPIIHPGDYVLISGSWQGLNLNQRICAFRTADGITLKQLILDSRRKVSWLWPINSSYKPVPYDKDGEQFTLVGVLILSIRQYT